MSVLIPSNTRTLSLAVSADPAPHDDSRPADSPPRRILVVDDDHDAVDSLALLLTLMGHEVRTAYDGPAALEVARAYRPGVVLLDIAMPGMDGYEVARRFREQPGQADVVLVALSGYGRDEDKRRAHEAGCNAHLTKPADLNALYVVLGERRVRT